MARCTDSAPAFQYPGQQMQKWKTTSLYLLPGQIKSNEFHTNTPVAFGSSMWEDGAALTKASNSCNHYKLQKSCTWVAQFSTSAPYFNRKISWTWLLGGREAARKRRISTVPQSQQGNRESHKLSFTSSPSKKISSFWRENSITPAEVITIYPCKNMKITVSAEGQVSGAGLDGEIYMAKSRQVGCRMNHGFVWRSWTFPISTFTDQAVHLPEWSPETEQAEMASKSTACWRTHRYLPGISSGQEQK